MKLKGKLVYIIISIIVIVLVLICVPIGNHKGIKDYYDKIVLNIVKKRVKSIDIIKGGQKLDYNYLGCTSIITPEIPINTITRGIKDKKIKMSIKINCGDIEEFFDGIGIIKKSEYKYAIKDAGNETNYYVKIENAKDYVLYEENALHIIGVYHSESDGAIVVAKNIEGKTNINMIFDNDQDTIYVVNKGDK